MCKLMHKALVNFKELEFSECLGSVIVTFISCLGYPEFGSCSLERLFSLGIL
jgi:hypothetical protein